MQVSSKAFVIFPILCSLYFAHGSSSANMYWINRIILQVSNKFTGKRKERTLKFKKFPNWQAAIKLQIWSLSWADLRYSQLSLLLIGCVTHDSFLPWTLGIITFIDSYSCSVNNSFLNSEELCCSHIFQNRDPQMTASKPVPKLKEAKPPILIQLKGF